MKVIFIWSQEEKPLSHLLRCVSASLCRYLCRLFERCVCWAVTVLSFGCSSRWDVWISTRTPDYPTARTNTSTLVWQTHLEYFWHLFLNQCVSWSTWDVVHVTCSPDVTSWPLACVSVGEAVQTRCGSKKAAAATLFGPNIQHQGEEGSQKGKCWTTLEALLLQLSLSVVLSIADQ